MHLGDTPTRSTMLSGCTSDTSRVDTFRLALICECFFVCCLKNLSKSHFRAFTVSSFLFALLFVLVAVLVVLLVRSQRQAKKNMTRSVLMPGSIPNTFDHEHCRCLCVANFQVPSQCDHVCMHIAECPN